MAQSSGQSAGVYEDECAGSMYSTFDLPSCSSPAFDGCSTNGVVNLKVRKTRQFGSREARYGPLGLEGCLRVLREPCRLSPRIDYGRNCAGKLAMTPLLSMSAIPSACS